MNVTGAQRADGVTINSRATPTLKDHEPMNKSRNAVRLDDLPPKMRAQALAQLGQPELPPIPEAKAPRALQPMKEKKTPKLRQSQKPLMNRLETEYFNHLKGEYPSAIIIPQGIRWMLGNGIWYKPDFVMFMEKKEDVAPGHYYIRCYEVKGPHVFRGGFENLKVAASKYPHVRFVLVSKTKSGTFDHQLIIP